MQEPNRGGMKSKPATSLGIWFSMANVERPHHRKAIQQPALRIDSFQNAFTPNGRPVTIGNSREPSIEGIFCRVKIGSAFPRSRPASLLPITAISGEMVG
jgi:hypothetical protein